MRGDIRRQEAKARGIRVATSSKASHTTPQRRPTTRRKLAVTTHATDEAKDRKSFGKRSDVSRSNEENKLRHLRSPKHTHTCNIAVWSQNSPENESSIDPCNTTERRSTLRRREVKKAKQIESPSIPKHSLSTVTLPSSRSISYQYRSRRNTSKT